MNAVTIDHQNIVIFQPRFANALIIFDAAQGRMFKLEESTGMGLGDYLSAKTEIEFIKLEEEREQDAVQHLLNNQKRRLLALILKKIFIWKTQIEQLSFIQQTLRPLSKLFVLETFNYLFWDLQQLVQSIAIRQKLEYYFQQQELLQLPCDMISGVFRRMIIHTYPCSLNIFSSALKSTKEKLMILHEQYNPDKHRNRDKSTKRKGISQSILQIDQKCLGDILVFYHKAYLIKINCILPQPSEVQLRIKFFIGSILKSLKLHQR